MRPKRAYRDKILSLPELLDRVDSVRDVRPSFANAPSSAKASEGRPSAARDSVRLVFTNGCFDLLHTGHLQLLEAAAARGNLLVVGVNEDASVAALKGGERPFVPFEQRAALLAGLEAVDYVVGFAEPTPLALIEALVPDVLVKGADWGDDAIVGRSVVEAAGGQVVRQPLVKGRSTTDLVRRIRAAGAEAAGG